MTNEKKQRLLNLLEEATKHFEGNLSNKDNITPVEFYLKQRGLNKKTIKKFRIGYAINGWDCMIKEFLSEKGYTQEDMLEVGLIKKNKEGKTYDRFRDRIIFPIFDLKGRPVAFVGRYFSTEYIMDMDMGTKQNIPKYLNSPTTPFFGKSNILFGLNFAKEEAQKRDYFILVEGQMDLVLNHQIGFNNCIAVSGTSLTENHLSLMSMYSKNLIFAFDSDRAGRNATFRGAKKAIEFGFNVKIVNIPKDSDPADIILKDKEKWKEIIKNSKNMIDFYIDEIIDLKLGVKEEIKEMEKKVFYFISIINDSVKKEKYIKKIANRFRVDIACIRQIIKLTEIEIENESRWR